MLDIANRDRKAERREATRREILDAAWQLARERGLAAVTLRDVAALVGMRAPSLYSHFDSKNAIYDAMYEAAWADCARHLAAARRSGGRDGRTRLNRSARAYFDFSVADLARYQLMNQRSIPDFTPTPCSYAAAVQVADTAQPFLREVGITDPAGF